MKTSSNSSEWNHVSPMKHAMTTARKNFTTMAVGLLSLIGIDRNVCAVTIQNWYASPNAAYAMGANGTVLPPSGWYSGNIADNGPGNDQFRFYRRSDSNIGFKFIRQGGDTNAYIVTLNLTGYFEKGGAYDNSMVLLVGGDAYGVNDSQSGTYFNGYSTNLLQVASQSADGPFTWSNVNFVIPASAQKAYVLVGYAGDDVGGMGNHVYSMGVSFAVAPRDIFYPSQNSDLQSSIDYIASTGGGTVWIENGVHAINSPVTVRSNVKLEGNANMLSVLKQTFVTDNSLLVTEPGTVNVALRRVAFVMDSPIAWPNYAAFFFANTSSNITVNQCSFDSAKPLGQYVGHICQVNPYYCSGVSISENTFKNAIDGTGMNCGNNGYIGFNTISNIADTGIGLWTGATNCTIEYNTVDCFDNTAVCVDVDGGIKSTIRKNTFRNAQVGVRLFDSHYGVYPVRGINIVSNTLNIATTGPQGNPPIGIKVVHSADTNHPNYDLQFVATGNTITSSSYGVALYGYGNIAADQFMQAKLELNTFAGAGDALHIEGYNNSGLFKLDGGTGNTYTQTGNVINPKTTINTIAGGGASVFTNDISFRVANYTTLTTLTTSWKQFNLGTFGKGVYGVAVTITPTPPGNSAVQMSISGFYPGQYTYPNGGKFLWSYHAQQASGPINVYLKKFNTSTTYKVTAIELFRLY